MIITTSYTSISPGIACFTFTAIALCNSCFFSPAVRFDSLRSFRELEEDGFGFEGIWMFWMLGAFSPCAWPGPSSPSPLHFVSGFLFLLFLVHFFCFLLHSPAVPRTLFTFSRTTHKKDIDILHSASCISMKMN